MNAAKQEMFESVRAVVSGRLRDEAQVRELAHRVSEESTALRRRVERAVGYARAGLRLEACAEAEAEPTVFELAAAFDADVMRQWRSLCAKNKLPVQDEIGAEAIAEIEEAIALTAPLRSRLALMRRLVLSDASAWHRLEVLRELISRDPDNPAWHEDRAALEPVAADELGDRFEDDLGKGDLGTGDLEDAETCVSRLEDGKWHWSGAGKIGAQLRTRLDRALAARTAGEAREAVAQLDAEWSAENESGARAAMERWRDLEQRMLSFGGDMPGDLLARVDEVGAWLSARESDVAAIRENRDRVSTLERLAQDESATLLQLRTALRAAEQTIEGVPDDVRASAERRIDAFERAARTKRVALVAAAVVVLVSAVVATVMLLRAAERDKRVDDMARAVVSNVEAGRLEEADRQLGEAEKDPAAAGTPQLADARKRLAAARDAIAEKSRQFTALMAEAGDAESPAAKPDRIEEAKQFVQTDAEQSAVADWIKRHGRSTESRRTARMQEGVDRAKATVREIADAAPTGDASWDGRYTGWESALADVQRQYGEFPEVMEQVRVGRTAIAAQRAKTDAARVETGRVGKLAVLGAAATAPAALASALETYSAEHPDSAEAKDFTQALAARPSWDALAAWSAVSPRPTVALADRPQKDRDAALAAVEGYAAAHPASPYNASIAALKPLLGPAPSWRSWLTEKLTSMESLTYWMTETKDGLRWYSRTDPRRASMQSQGGVNFRALTVIQGKTAKDSFEKFEQLKVKSEGPSPQMAFAKQLTDLLDNDEKAVNDIDAAFDAISALRENESMDGALAASLMRGMLEAMAPEMPEVLRPQLEQAAKRIAREKPDDIDWLNPRDTDARTRSRAARGAMREAAQPELWRKAYVSAVAAACAPLAQAYDAAGVLVKPDGKATVLSPGAGGPAAGTALWVAEPPVGDTPGTMIKLGTAKGGGAVDFEPAANTVPAGTLVFITKGGGTP